jgi:hypothetical protein
VLFTFSVIKGPEEVFGIGVVVVVVSVVVVVVGVVDVVVGVVVVVEGVVDVVVDVVDVVVGFGVVGRWVVVGLKKSYLAIKIELHVTFRISFKTIASLDLNHNE